MIPVYEDEEVIAEVKYNNDLDHWDGRNYTCGSTGRHKGLTQLDDGRFVLIFGTQWQGERDSAEVISKEQAVQEILASGNTELFDDYPELQELREKLSKEVDTEISKVFSIRINRNATQEEINSKIDDMKAKIVEFLKI